MEAKPEKSLEQLSAVKGACARVQNLMNLFVGLNVKALDPFISQIGDRFFIWPRDRALEHSTAISLDVDEHLGRECDERYGLGPRTKRWW